YRMAWVFASPSTYEGFGLCYVEALARGTTVLCTPNSGARYVLDEGTYGVSSEAASSGNKLVDLLENPERRKLFEAKGMVRAKDFSPTSIASQHRKVYREVVVMRDLEAGSVKSRYVSTHEKTI